MYAIINLISIETGYISLLNLVIISRNLFLTHKIVHTNVVEKKKKT